jgi:hypothetical protein
MNNFDALMNEIECINSAWGYTGAFDALVYIRDNADEYKGTQTYREFRAFMAEGARMFAETA